MRQLARGVRRDVFAIDCLLKQPVKQNKHVLDELATEFPVAQETVFERERDAPGDGFPDARRNGFRRVFRETCRDSPCSPSELRGPFLAQPLSGRPRCDSLESPKSSMCFGSDECNAQPFPNIAIIPFGLLAASSAEVIVPAATVSNAEVYSIAQNT